MKNRLKDRLEVLLENVKNGTMSVKEAYETITKWEREQYDRLTDPSAPKHGW